MPRRISGTDQILSEPRDRLRTRDVFQVLPLGVLTLMSSHDRNPKGFDDEHLNPQGIYSTTCTMHDVDAMVHRFGLETMRVHNAHATHSASKNWGFPRLPRQLRGVLSKTVQ